MGVIFILIDVYTVKYCNLNLGDICEKKEAIPNPQSPI